VTTQSADPMIGRLLDGRYQVRSRIARGGMATVYLATDLRLERRVAVKIMHGHLADDSQYKARFIQEARSAARLAHPNVVNVYDQGQDADTAYLVMEYLPGITLRDLLSEHKVLTTVQAMDILEAVLSGLAAAHKHGIVHRDLKPENILLADDGRIKISDFGLARAAHANTATGNALLGTIAYLSPELVTRGVADTRSDIYALGIMLYEMLAGEQPFKGEQAFQIAHQHANDTVPTPSSKNPRVPEELDELVLWATARDPEQRPRDARAMLDQLYETQRLLADDADTTVALQHTMVMPAAAPSPGADDATQIITPATRERRAPAPQGNASTLKAKSDRRRAKGYWLFGLVLLLAGLAGGTGWYFGSGPGSMVTVPSVSGQTVEAATDALIAVDLQVSDTQLRDHDPEVPVGQVVGTDPAEGQAVAHDGIVKLIISDGPEPLPIPVLVGETEDVAKQLVTDGGFTLDESSYQFDPEIAEGVVIDALGVQGEETVSLPTLETYGDQQPVTLVVSLGPIPNVSDMTVEEARDTLANANLNASEGAHSFHDTIEAGRVISARQQGDGPVREGDTVDLIISDGIEQVAVPDVVGKVWSEAEKILRDAGFEIEFGGSSEAIARTFPNSSTVRAIEPEVGATVDKGSTVRVRLSVFG
jgi:beta-lactam-binding protein with PASTA domain/tRNA A-37 threonylcarbamoyl transferase component Bud32